MDKRIPSILGRDFIIVGSEKWVSGNQTSKHHIARQLLKRGARVLYVENISMRSFGSEGKKRDLSKAFKALSRFFAGVHSPLPKLFCFAPVYIPFPRFRIARWLNSVAVPLMIRWQAFRLGMKRPVYLYFMPTGVQVQGRLGERLAAYYIVDNYAAFADVEQEAMRRLEAEALEKADVVFATATTLVEARRAVRPDICFSPHGVDFEHFAQTRTPETVLPPEARDLPRPVIGFMGGIAHDSVDIGLLKELVRRRRDWTLFLFGRALTDISALTSEPNVRFVGPKPYEELPSYLAALDVGLIPFLVNDLTRDLNPIKLREYLAAGLPVVGTDLPAVRAYAPLVHCAIGVEAFENAIKEILENPPDPESLQSAVMNETWEARVGAVLEAMARKAVSLAEEQSSVR
jgi:glycosyltransferase involved in cell wall biosynthesis